MPASFHRGGATDAEKEEFDTLADQFGQQGFTLDYVGGAPMLRAYDDQDDADNDVFERIIKSSLVTERLDLLYCVAMPLEHLASS